MRKTQIRELVRGLFYNNIDRIYNDLSDSIKLSLDDDNVEYGISYAVALLRSACKRIDIDYSATNISESEEC